MKIYIVAFGKLKIPGLLETFHYYQRNIQPWCQFKLIELKATENEGQKSIQKSESELIRFFESELGNRSQIFLLDERGKSLPTLEWANLITSAQSHSINQIAFCIGDSFGFSEAIKANAKARLLSLGPQTLAHDLARVVLVEQLYRAFSVVNRHPYHHA